MKKKEYQNGPLVEQGTIVVILLVFKWRNRNHLKNGMI